MHSQVGILSYEAFGIRSWIGLEWRKYIPNFMKIFPVILELSHAYKQTSPEITFMKTDNVITDRGAITHAYNIADIGVLQLTALSLLLW